MSLDEIPPFFNKNVLVQNLHQKKNLRLDLNTSRENFSIHRHLTENN